MGGQSVRPLSLKGDLSSSEISRTEEMFRAQAESYGRATTIDTLPDDVLLDIFVFYRNYSRRIVWEWYLLVHVCRRWRQIIFESPHRLNLQIPYTYRTLVKDLGIWPAFPIAILSGHWMAPKNEDNLIAALELPDRVRRINLNEKGSSLAKIVTVMQEPFPVLTHLNLASGDLRAVIPGGFLGGSAPRLQEVDLYGIPYPELPTLLLSTGNLVGLRVIDIPPTGYILPEAMAMGLAALSKLETLLIEFRSAFPHPDQIRLPPVTRIILPALASFEFKGASEYLEVLVAHMDGPQLNRIIIDYSNRLVDAPVTQLSKFIDRSVGPKLTLFKHAELSFYGDFKSFTMSHNAEWYGGPETRIAISTQERGRQLSHVAALLGQFSATEILSNVVHLKLHGHPEGRRLELDDARVEWLRLLHQFSAVRTLHVSQVLAGYVALALETITREMVAEVLPSLDSIYLEDQPASSIQKFVTTRRLSDCPVTIVRTTTEFSNRLQSSVST